MKSSSTLVFFLTLLTFVLAAAHFVDPGTAPFSWDIQFLQHHVQNALNTGSVPLRSLDSTRGIAYGPQAVWMYWLVRHVTSAPAAGIAVHMMTFGTAFIMLHLAMRKLYGGERALWSTLLALSSPFLFFYMRFAWDNTLLVPASALVVLGFAWLEQPQRLRRFEPLPWLLIGLGNGIALNTHPMALPLFLASLATIGQFARRHTVSRHEWVWGGSLFLGPVVIILAPYLISLFASMNGGPSAHFAPRIAYFGDHLLRAFQHISAWGMDYFWDRNPVALTRDWPDFLTALIGKDYLGHLLRLICFVFLLHNSDHLVHTLARWMLGFMLVYYSFFHVSIDPHYYQAAWWIAFVLVADTLYHLAGGLSVAMRTLVAAVIFLNIVYIGTSLAVLGRDGGTRGVVFGATYTNQRKLAGELCADMDARQVTEAAVDCSQISFGLDSLKYFSHTLPACRGKHFTLYRADGPPVYAEKPGYLDYLVTYGDETPTSAWLKWQKSPPPERAWPRGVVEGP